MSKSIATSSIMSNLATLIMKLLPCYLDPIKEIYQQPTKSTKLVHNHLGIDNDLTNIVGNHYGDLAITVRSDSTTYQIIIILPIPML